MVTPSAHPPETLEGWYALHQIYTCEKRIVDQPDTLGVAPPTVDEVASELAQAIRPPSPAQGWSAVVRLIGSIADVMVIHFRPTLEAIADAQRAVAELPASSDLGLEYSFLSVTEAGLYHLTAKLAQEVAARGGSVGDDGWNTAIRERTAVERESDHVRRRLYPPLPADMPYVCFYPMSKRRDAGQNWYTLTLDERSRLMQSHGLTGRRYAGRVQQIITGAIGFDVWEWGVTLFARDPLDFKKLVTDMRFDEVSAKYAEFGDFFVGKRVG
jgi:hydrogen peroxide-dependent heme synthase